MSLQRIGLLTLLMLIATFITLGAKSEPDLSQFFNLQRFGEPQEELLKEMKKAYTLKDYPRVIQVFEKLGVIMRLKPEDFLMVAEAYYRLGVPLKAIDLAERAISLRRGTSLACEGSLLKIKSLFLLGKKDLAQKELRQMEEGFCKEEFSKEIALLKAALENKFPEEIEGKEVKAYLEGLYEARFHFLMKEEKIKEAENLAYDYLNLTGDYRKGKDFFFKLAERYFKAGKVKEAKRYYQLIITEWDLTKEATISKFRLYQIAYEGAPLKELLPPKTLEDLLMFITQIKTKYSDDEALVEEVSFLEIRVNFDRKNWERVRSLSREFEKNFPESKVLTQARELYCRASLSLVSPYFLRGKVNALMEIADKESEDLERAKCGDFYYTLGKEFFNYRLYSQALDYLLSAFESQVSSENRPQLYLKLAFLAYLYQEKAILEALFKTLEKNWKKSLAQDPYYLYLEAGLNLDKDLEKGLQGLKELQKTSLPEVLQRELWFKAFNRAIELKRYKRAHEILQSQPFPPEEKEYLILLSATFDQDPRFFEGLLKEAKEKFPKSPDLSFLEAYHLERKGELKRTQELWKGLASVNTLSSQIADFQKRIQELTNRTQELVY